MAKVLRAKSIPDNKWFQRVDTGDKTIGRFQEEVAIQFSVSLSNIDVIVGDFPEADWMRFVAEMGSGSHEGLAVIPAVIKEDPRDKARKDLRDKPDNTAITVKDLIDIGLL